MDGIPETLIVIKVEGNNDFSYEFANQRALERTTLVASDIGKSVFDINSAGNEALYIENHKKVVQTKEMMTFEDTYTTPKGGLYYSEVKLTPLFEGESVSHIVILIHDITAKKIAELEIEASKEKLSESKLRYRSLFHYNIDTIFSLNLDGKVLKANAAIHNLTGYRADEVIGFTPKDFVVEEDIEKIEASFQKSVQGQATSANIKGVDRFGSRLELIVKFIPIKVKSDITGVYVILRDITEEKDLVEKLMESEKHFRIIAENSEDLIALISTEGKIDYLSPSSARMLGYDSNRMLGLSYIDLVHEEDLLECKQILDSSVVKQTCSKALYRMKNRAGEWVWLEMAATPVFDEKNNLVHVVAISRDMTVRLKYEERLKYLASHDFLTSLKNRRSFKEKLAAAWKEFTINKQGLALLMIDIDHFKDVNDEYGHDAGDYVLAQFAQRLKEVIGKDGVIFRFGGDEFAALMENTTKEKVVNFIESFQEELKEPWEVNPGSLDITSSIGIAFINVSLDEEITDGRFTKIADQALYEAKKTGRNNYKLKEIN